MYRCTSHKLFSLVFQRRKVNPPNYLYKKYLKKKKRGREKTKYVYSTGQFTGIARSWAKVTFINPHTLDIRVYAVCTARVLSRAVPVRIARARLSEGPSPVLSPLVGPPALETRPSQLPSSPGTGGELILGNPGCR